jgi:hypothetical protein
LGITKPSTTTSTTLEKEAKEFRAKRKSPPVKPKPMTSKIYLAGQAMSALLSRSQGPVRREDIKREAYEWADYMLSDE